ncbi:uncharacterized protein MONBRDRAFT_13036 [Monosiga brevicollis MX1]|uniref:peptide-methionine (S)-S-oxide reductase n=1 Tax=Monosiga brevicollis TaxID=81824 RepID=A9VE28_MONBE|nr:uncharacterized protein MONBRDRAFT_13036 [Monosiga brevicollis MX1]EDQ84191.1 predicted protein [Monosiga brevicollis MX1]|eukprot:XP_001750979.1 hypothetical protein [Monosiga brevicollis MX1]
MGIGTERVFHKRLPGVYTTAVGYTGGDTPNPTYKEVCTGLTNHNEVVLVVWDPAKLHFVDVMKAFWESHDVTQGNGQGGDVGTQYRSGLYVNSEEQRVLAEAAKAAYQQYLDKPGNRQYCGAQPLGTTAAPSTVLP